MSLNNKKVLVIGASGLIGKYVVNHLIENNFDVLCVSRNPIDMCPKCICGDIFEKNFIEEIFERFKPHYLFNLAWITSGDYLVDTINYDYLFAYLHILKCFSLNSGKRVVSCGSCFEYSFSDEALMEISTLDVNKTKYTFTKDLLRKYSKEFCAKNNISSVWARIFYVYDENESSDRFYGKLCSNLSQNLKFEIKFPDLKRDYLPALEVANYLVKLLFSDIEDEVNICSSKAISYYDLALKKAKELNKEHLLILNQMPTNQTSLILGDNQKLKGII